MCFKHGGFTTNSCVVLPSCRFCLHTIEKRKAKKSLPQNTGSNATIVKNSYPVLKWQTYDILKHLKWWQKSQRSGDTVWMWVVSINLVVLLVGSFSSYAVFLQNEKSPIVSNRLQQLNTPTRYQEAPHSRESPTAVQWEFGNQFARCL